MTSKLNRKQIIVDLVWIFETGKNTPFSEKSLISYDYKLIGKKVNRHNF
jgi:hypothetical protein